MCILNCLILIVRLGLQWTPLIVINYALLYDSISRGAKQVGATAAMPPLMLLKMYKKLFIDKLGLQVRVFALSPLSDN